MKQVRNSPLTGHLFAIFCVTAWGTSFLISKSLMTKLMPAQLMWLRFVIAYLAMWVVCPRWHFLGKEEWRVLLLSLIGNTLYFFSENTALQLTQATNVSILVSSAPILSILLLRFFRQRDRISGRKLIGIFLAFFGVLLVVFNGVFVLKLNPIGDALALMAALFWALYGFLAKPILERYDELEVKRNTFMDAMKDNAFEQLQGQIASARVPLNRFSSKTLYWILSGDDFSLDINNPEEPKIICIANNPRRQSVYGTTLALMMSQLFKQVNVPGKMHSGILIDELPTIYLKGLDNLIDTGRSNKVAVVIGAQDKSQLVRDYDDKESEVIFNTVGNVFAGAVKGDTAKELAQSFGKAEKESHSLQQGDTSEHLTISYQLRDVLPPDKIEALSQGSFCGYIADTFKQKIHPKVFCGEIDAGLPPKSNASVPKLIDLSEVQMRLLVEQNYKRIRLEVANFVQEEMGKGKG